MYADHRILCVIPARAGSKGLPGKNIKNLCGQPLIAYSIKQALGSRYIDRVIVSTDSAKIAGVAREHGAEAPFTRPDDLAADTTSSIDVLLHAMNWLESREGYVFDILVLLHATAPLRDTADIDQCVEMLVDADAGSVFSVTPAHRNPYFNMVEVFEDGQVRLAKEGNFVTRQAAPKVFDVNASIYAWRKDVLKQEKTVITKNSLVYVMPKERSIDVDDALDFEIAEMLMAQKEAEPC